MLSTSQKPLIDFMDNRLQTPTMVVRTDLSDRLIKDFSGFWTTLKTASECNRFRIQLDKNAEQGFGLEYGYLSFSNPELKAILKGTTLNYAFDQENEIHPDVYRYAMDIFSERAMDYWYKHDTFYGEVLYRDLTALQYFMSHEVQQIHNLKELKLYLIAYLLQRKKFFKRKHRLTILKLTEIINNLPSKFISKFNLELLTTIPQLYPVRKHLIYYLLQTGSLLSGTHLAKLSTYSGLKTPFYDSSNDTGHNNLKVVEQVASNIAHQSRSDIEILLEDWNSIASSLSDQQLKNFFTATEQGLLTLDVNISSDTKSFIASSLHNTSNVLGESISKTTQKLTKIADGLGSVFQSTMSRVSESISESVFKLKELVFFVVAALIVGIATYYGIKLIAKLFSFFTTLIFGYQSTESTIAFEQSNADDSWSGPWLLLTSVFGVPSALLKTGKLFKLVSLLAQLPRAEAGLESVFKWMRATYLACYRLFSKYVLGVDPGITIEAESHPVAKWLEQLQEQYQLFIKGVFTYDTASFSLVHGLFLKGLELQRSVAFKTDSMAIKTGMDCLNKILQEFRVKNICAGSVRNPPVVIYLHGGSGVGKSTLTNILAARIVAKIQPNMDRETLKLQWKNLIYSRASEMEFWDNYTGQLVTVFDDYSQRTDSAANPNTELFEIVRAANVYPYPLHMADLSSKGATNFTSKLIICSSNLAKPKTESLNFPEALYRRFDVCIRVTRNPKYEKKELSEFVDDFYQFEKYDMQTQKSLGTTTWSQIISDSVELYQKRTKFVDSLDKTIDMALDDTKVLIDETPKLRRPHLTFEDYVCLNPEATWGDYANAITEQSLFNSELDKYDDYTLSGLFEQMDHTEKKLSWKEYFTQLWTGRPKTIKDAFDQLNTLSTSYLEKSKARFASWTELIHQRFPYLSSHKTALMLVGLLITGPLTLYALKKVFSPKKPQSTNIVLPSPESYNTPQAKPAKIEGYNQPATKPVKIESKEEKIELAFPDGKLSGTEMNLSAKTLDAYASAILKEAASDQNAAEICSKLIVKNLFRITVEGSTHYESMGHVLFIKGRIGLMPHHFVKPINFVLSNDPKATVKFSSVFQAGVFSMLAKDFVSQITPWNSPELDCNDVVLDSRDLCSFVITHGWSFPDITKLFVSKSDVSYVHSSDVLLPILKVPDTGKAFSMIRVGRATSGIRSRDVTVVGASGDRPRKVRSAWYYPLDTEAGDCGAPLVMRNPHVSGRKILGLHVAGDTQFGYSTPIYQEDLTKILSIYEPHQLIVTEQCHPVHMPKGCHLPDTPSFFVVDKLTKPLYQPTKTVISPSPIHGILSEVKTRPCQLRDTSTFSPMAYRLEKFASVPPPIDEALVRNATNATFGHISQVLTERLQTITTDDKPYYTFEEAVQGLPEEDFLNAVKRKSSPGYPFVLDPDWNKKTKIFGNDEIFKLDTPQALIIKDKCESLRRDAISGKRNVHVFIDTLKDERKPIHKSHKTRMFSACSLEYLILCKQYFGGVVSILQKNRNYCGISVGTNVYSYDWHNISKVLLSKSNNMIAGDFEGFDSSQHQRILRAAGEVLVKISKEFLNASDEEVQVMNVLLESLYSSVHLNKDIIYVWNKCLPSGHFLTALINSIFVLLSFNMCWQNCFGITKQVAYSFFQQCGIVAYGDDHIVSVPTDALESFNQYTLIDLFKLIGLSYTLEDKDATVDAPSRPLSQVSYLKRRFEWDDGRQRYVAPLHLDSVLETPMWVKNCADINLQTFTELENSLKELSLHSKDIWKQHITKFKTSCKVLGHHSQFLDYEHARNFVLNGNM